MSALRLLVVEDSADDAELIVRTLRRAGFDLTCERVETSAAMQAALAHEAWDLVISDFSLPRFNGLAALKLLREKELDLPFILVSGTIGEEVAVQAMKAGAQDYILKGNLARLAPAVERELGEYQVRRERRRAESRYRNLFNSVPVGVFITSPDGKLTDANPWFVAMLGFPDKESLLRVDLSEIRIHPEERPRLYALIEHQGFIDNFEVEFRRVDGKALWCSLSTTITYDAEGKIDHFEGVSLNITERKRIELELSAARDAALEGERIKSAFMATMSHEIRTPLNGLIGMNELLLKSGLNAQQMEYASTASDCGNRLITIVNDILNFSKLIEGQVVFERLEFDLPEVLETTIESFAERADSKGLELVLAMAGGLPTSVIGDPNRLRQVLNNLIGNALKFTYAGEVALKVALQDQSPDEATFRFEIQDTGIGILQTSHSALFKPFAQADSSTTRKFGGIGLGLKISAQLVAGMKGRIYFESVEGAGSKFTFTAVFGKRDPTAAIVNTLPFSRRRVLIVDDNATSRNALVDLTRSWGMIADSAPGGSEALVATRAHSADASPYDVIVLDEQMPNIDGPTVARTLRDRSGPTRTPLIMLGTIAKSLPSASVGADESDYRLSKPVRPSQLYLALRAVLEIRPANPQKGITDQGEVRTSTFAATAGSDVSLKPGRILVVDDNPVNRRVAQKQTERLGYLVDTVESGKAALNAMAGAGASYSVVLMDCEMPDMDGYATTREIRRCEGLNRHTTIIAVTTHALDGEREHCLEAGMDDYVAKPVTLESLSAVLERALH